MNYIKRDIESRILSLTGEYSCILITGPRQVGKTTVLKQLMTDDREYVTLDDLQERRLARTDPAMFMQTHSLPIFIDEVQYAPELFSYIKIAIDNAPADMKELYERIWKGSMPGFASGRFTDRDVFYSSYLQTYIERDVSELIERVDKMMFADFVRAAACRTGQLLNVHDIAMDVGVSDETAKRWLSVLERSDVIFYLRPYSNNLLKRTIKTPKMYFFDTGLVAYLTRYSSPEILANGAINGAILENYVVSEIRKSYFNDARDCLMWYYRDKESNEIDMVIESDGELHPLEIKRSVNPASEIVSAFSVLDKGSVPRGRGAIICMRPELSAVNSDNLIVPVWMI